jgi:hypothetical protein
MRIAVQARAERLTRLEEGNTLAKHRDGRPVFRVSARTRAAPPRFEDAEPAQLDTPTGSHLPRDCVEEQVDKTFDIGSSKLGIVLTQAPEQIRSHHQPTSPFIRQEQMLQPSLA